LGGWRNAIGLYAASPSTRFTTHFGLFASIPAANKIQRTILTRGDKNRGNKVQSKFKVKSKKLKVKSLK
jgi:hypothetical protein